MHIVAKYFPPLILLAAFSLIGLLSGSAIAQESQTLRKIKETGIVTLGYRDQSIPFSYLDDKQKPIGYSIDLCMAVVDGLKKKLALDSLEVKLSPISSANRMPLIGNGLVDLDCGTTSNTVERRNKVSFSITTFVAAIHVVAKKSSHIRTIEDLTGKSVVTTAGATSVARLVQLNRERNLGLHIIVGKDHADSFQMLEADRAVAFVMDDAVLYGLAASSSQPDAYAILDEALSTEPYGISMRKDDVEFKRVVDDAIVDLFRSGEIYRLYKKWFLSPIPPRQINLRMPMSAELRKVIAQYVDAGAQH